MNILEGTSSIHAETFARALGVEVVRGLHPTNSLFVVGVTPELSSLITEYRNAGTKVIAYWIGSDSLSAVGNPEVRSKICEYDQHLCVHERIQYELSLWGVKAEVVYPCARNHSTGLPKPEKKLVGVYMPEPDLYMFKECKELAYENPDLEFAFYGNLGEPYDLPANAKDIGRHNPEENGDLLEKFSVMLRLCRHDGFPVGGIEMKQRNRHVIENFQYPGFLYAPTMEMANSFLRDPKVHEGDFGTAPSWYREQCSPQKFKENVEHLCS